MVRTITFFNNIERDIALVVALAQNIDAYIGVQSLKTGYVSNGQGNVRPATFRVFCGKFDLDDL